MTNNKLDKSKTILFIFNVTHFIYRGPVAQDHSNLDCYSENCHTVAQVATRILNISCANSVAGLLKLPF